MLLLEDLEVVQVNFARIIPVTCLPFSCKNIQNGVQNQNQIVADFDEHRFLEL